MPLLSTLSCSDEHCSPASTGHHSIITALLHLLHQSLAVDEVWFLCRSVVERLVQARLVYQRPSMARAISFEYLNRQLVWHELSELLLFMLPLVNLTKIRRLLTAWLPRMKGPQAALQGTPLLSATIILDKLSFSKQTLWKGLLDMLKSLCVKRVGFKQALRELNVLEKGLF